MHSNALPRAWAEARTIGECLARTNLPRLEAQMLLAAVTGLSRAQLLTRDGEPIARAHSRTFFDWCARRLAGEPIAYLVGQREFYGIEFAVNRDVLIPRPETELLVELALARVASGARRVLDLGTGSGALAVAIAKHAPGTEVWAVDRSPAALEVARMNADRHQVAVEFVASSWFDAIAGERFDVIVANPPYVAAGDPHLAEGDLRFEPPDALIGGVDGLVDVRAIAASANPHLTVGGWIGVEHGYDQGARVAELFTAHGLRNAARHDDLAGIWRVTSAVR